MKLKIAYILCGIFFLLLCIFLPPSGRYDTAFWVDWAQNLKIMGMAHAYKIEALNYNPLYLYVIRFFSAITPADKIEQNIMYLKIITLLFDFGAIMVLMYWLKKHNRPFLLSLLILFNIAYLYNTLCWGQIDAIHTTLLFFAVLAALEKNLPLSILMFLLALNIKTQSILFLPPLGLIWLPLLRISSIKTYAKTVGWVVLIQTLIVLPYILKGTIGDVWNNLVGVVDYNPYLSLRACNLWYVCVWDIEIDVPRFIGDSRTYFGIACKTWGFSLFFVFATLVLLPLFIKSLHYTLKGKTFGFADAEVLFLTLTLVTLVFFYFLTQMHERYSHPALLFAGVYFVLTRRWVMFLFICYAYVMNLESIDKYWEWDNYKTFAFDPRFLACLYGAALLIGLVDLYRRYNLKNDFIELLNAISSKPFKA